jgi:hypothetical protein
MDIKEIKALGSDLFVACSLMKKLASVLSWLGALSDYQIPGYPTTSYIMSDRKWRDAHLIQGK